MTASMPIACSGCGNESWLHGETVMRMIDDGRDKTYECGTCVILGDRSLVKLLRDPTPERIAAFRASPPGSVLFAESLRKRGIPLYGTGR